MPELKISFRQNPKRGNHEEHPIRLLTKVLCIFTIYVQKCCVETLYILSNAAGEEPRRGNPILSIINLIFFSREEVGVVGKKFLCFVGAKGREQEAEGN